MIRSKEALKHFNQYAKSQMKNIWQAYENPSYNKEKAWHYCEEMCYLHNGYDLKVISKNTFQFTAGFKFPLYGDLEGFAYITAKYDRYYELQGKVTW